MNKKLHYNAISNKGKYLEQGEIMKTRLHKNKAIVLLNQQQYCYALSRGWGETSMARVKVQNPLFANLNIFLWCNKLEMKFVGVKCSSPFFPFLGELNIVSGRLSVNYEP